jgi:uncharacterized membrane protein YgaE (UPF0421/DUF939 family)
MAEAGIASAKAQSTWWPVFVHSVRTAVAAVVSFLVARLFRLPEAYWAPITTLVITQSSLGAALAVSRERMVGNALGALVGAIVASYFEPNILVFGISIFILGLLSFIARSDRSAYRFAGVTLAIVMLVPRTAPAWIVALHRFTEVSIGIAVALILTVVWPESEDTQAEAKQQRTSKASSHKSVENSTSGLHLKQPPQASSRAPAETRYLTWIDR